MKTSDLMDYMFILNLIFFGFTVLDMIIVQQLTAINFALFCIFLFNIFATIMVDEVFVKNKVFNEDNKNV